MILQAEVQKRAIVFQNLSFESLNSRLVLKVEVAFDEPFVELDDLAQR